jgi:hypothetical protein
MRRFAGLAILVAGCAMQAQAPYYAKNALNGLAWRSLSASEKTLYVTGALEAFYMAYELQMAHANLECVRSVVGASPMLLKGTLPDLRREVESFYENADNIPIPIMDALGYSAMRLSGASKTELEEYKTAAFRAVLN